MKRLPVVGFAQMIATAAQAAQARGASKVVTVLNSQVQHLGCLRHLHRSPSIRLRTDSNGGKQTVYCAFR